MALILEKTLPNGFTPNYWIVRRLSFDYHTRTSCMKIQVFKDEAFRRANPDSPALESEYHFDDDAYFLTPENMESKTAIELAYDAVKLLPDFSGAVDG